MEPYNANIFKSEFKNVRSYIDPISSNQLYTMDDWMFIESKPPASNGSHTILTGGLEPFSYSGAVLCSGGSTVTPFYNSGETSVVSKKVFKYNPTKYYKIRIRAKYTGTTATATLVAGFVGLTTLPVYDLVTLSSNKDLNDIANFSRCVMSAAGAAVTPDLWSSALHFNCIHTPLAMTNDGVYRENEGVINGKVAAGFNFQDYTYGVAANKPQPVLDEILYVAPYFIVNKGSIGTDVSNMFIDFITVEEISDSYVI